MATNVERAAEERQREWLARGEVRGRAKGRRLGKVEGLREGEARGEAKGEAKGKAEALVAMLDARGLEATAEQRASLLGCRDLATLDLWVRQAATTRSVDALLSVAPSPRPPPKPRR